MSELEPACFRPKFRVKIWCLMEKGGEATNWKILVRSKFESLSVLADPLRFFRRMSIMLQLMRGGMDLGTQRRLDSTLLPSADSAIDQHLIRVQAGAPICPRI